MSIPLPRICWPYNIVTGVNDRIVVQCALVNSGNPITAIIAADTTGSTYPTPEALATAVAAAMQTAIANGITVSITVSTSGFAWLAIDEPGGTGVFTVKWSTASGLGKLLGFASAISGTDQALSWEDLFTHEESYAGAEDQMQNFWYPGLPVRSDPRERSTYPRTVVETATSAVTVDLTTAIQRRTISFENLPAAKTLVSQEGSLVNQALERLFVAPTGGYSKLRWYDDATNLSIYATYALREKTSQQFAATRMYDALELYKLTLEMTATS